MGTAKILAGIVAAVVGSAGAVAVPPGDTSTVSYRGYRVAVPADWAVVDLAADPHACVRFDRPPAAR